MDPLKTFFILQMVIFHCHVSFRGLFLMQAWDDIHQRISEAGCSGALSLRQDTMKRSSIGHQTNVNVQSFWKGSPSSGVFGLAKKCNEVIHENLNPAGVSSNFCCCPSTLWVNKVVVSKWLLTVIFSFNFLVEFDAWHWVVAGFGRLRASPRLLVCHRMPLVPWERRRCKVQYLVSLVMPSSFLVKGEGGQGGSINAHSRIMSCTCSYADLLKVLFAMVFIIMYEWLCACFTYFRGIFTSKLIF